MEGNNFLIALSTQTTRTQVRISQTPQQLTDTSGKNPFVMPWFVELIYGLVYLLMVLVAAGGNLIVIWIVLGHKRMRTVTNYFLVNLAVSDLLITIFNTMFNFLYMCRSHWPFGMPYCKFTSFIVPCTITASVFTFVAIALDRYLVIVYPLKPRLRSRTVLGVIGGIWVISISIASPTLVYSTIFVFASNRTVCYLAFPFETPTMTFDFWYNLFIFILTYVTPLLVMTFTYSRVSCKLWGSEVIGEMSARHKETIRKKR